MGGASARLRADDGDRGHGHGGEQLRARAAGRRSRTARRHRGGPSRHGGIAPSRASRPVVRRPAGDHADQRLARLGGARSRQDDRLEDLPESAVPRRYSCSPGATARPSASASPGSTSSHSSSAVRVPAAAAAAASPAAASLLPGRSPVNRTERAGPSSRQQAAVHREVGAAQRPCAELGRGPGGDLRQDPHICSGAEMPSRPSEAAIVRWVSRQRPRRERSTPSPSAPTTWQSR